MKNTVATFRAAKGKSKLSMLTSYDYSMARLMDASGINSLLVGDSLGMVSLGYPDTLRVTLEDMISHCAAVARGCKNALVVCDMPFMSYQCNPAETVTNAGRLVKEGFAQAVKLEGGEEFAKDVEALVRASIPVMGHLGLTPQSINAMGGYKVQGKDLEAARKLIADARALEKAGAFAVVLECVPAPLAKLITENVGIPTIGIGAGPDCDGQVLVWQDMLGVNMDLAPKFARRFAEVGELMRAAFAQYKTDVENGVFPAEEHCFAMEKETLEKLARDVSH